MKIQPWVFLTNFALAASEGSFINAYRISQFHDAALAARIADPYFKAIYDIYHPIHVAFETAYNNWKAQGGMQQGLTLNLTQLLALEVKKIKNWDIAIQAVYDDTTKEYRTLLPNNRIPFQRGTQIGRITAVSVLEQNLANYPSLAKVHDEVLDFVKQINTVLDSQKAALSQTNNTSAAVEAARVKMCVEQFKNYGTLVVKYAETPSLIGDFFDQEHIRNHTQVVFTGIIKALRNKFIVKYTYAAGDEVYLENVGDFPITFYLSSSKDAVAAPALSITIDPNSHKVVTADKLGNIATDAFLHVFNPSSSESKYDVEIL